MANPMPEVVAKYMAEPAENVNPFPTGAGQKCDLSAAQEPGTPLPFRPARAAANNESMGMMGLGADPSDQSDDAVVDMKRDPYAGKADT